MPSGINSNKSKSGNSNKGNSSNRSNRNNGNSGGSLNHSAVHKPVPGKGGKGK